MTLNEKKKRHEKLNFSLFKSTSVEYVVVMKQFVNDNILKFRTSAAQFVKKETLLELRSGAGSLKT